MAYQPKSYRKFVATAATATLVASAVAPAAAAGFSDVSDKYQEAVDFVVSKGANGLTETSFGVSKEITRVDAAVLLANVLELDTEGAPAAGFTDVPSRAQGAVNALKAEGITNGKSATKFGATDLITRGELAVWIQKGFKLEGSAELSFTDVSSKYSEAVQALVANEITQGASATKFGVEANAKRGDYALFLHRAHEAVKAPATPEVVSVSAIASNKIEVKFNKDVKAADITLKNGLVNVAIDSVTYEGKVATITTVDKLQTANYTVDITVEEQKLSETVAVQAEKIADIEIAGTVLPKSTATAVAYTVFNQYGEEMEVASSNLNFVFSAGTAVDADGSDQAIAVKTDTLDVDSSLTVTILDSATGVSASKTFKVAAASAVSEFALTGVVLPETTPGTVRTYENTATTTLSFEASDQYGNKLSTYGELSGVQLVDSSSNVSFAWVDVDGGTDPSKKAKIVATVGALTSDENVVVTAVLPNGKTSKLTLPVYDSPKAANITVAGLSEVVANGDTGVAANLSVVDQYGTALTADQIATAVGNSEFTLNSTNTSVVNNVAIATTGDNKGKLTFDAVGAGTATITVVVNGTGKTANLTVTVGAARHVSKLEVANTPATKLLQGAATTVEYKLFDQYGKEWADVNDANYKVNLTLTKVSGDDAGVTVDVTGDQDESTIVGGTVNVAAAATKTGEYKLTAKVQNNAGTSTLSQVSTNFKVIDGKNETLTYAVSEIPTLYKAGSSSAYFHNVTVAATDASGNKVAIPSSAITSVISSDTTVVDVDGTKVFGKAKGTATVTIVFTTPKGTKTVSKEVTVSDAELTAQSIKLVDSNGDVVDTLTFTNAAAFNTGEDLFDTAGFDLVVTDQFEGTSLSVAGKVNQYVDLTDITLTAPEAVDITAGVLSLNDGGDGIDSTISAGDSFKVTAVTQNGKTVTYTVKIN